MTTKSEILQAIRQKCLDCSVHQPSEVRLCPVNGCALWPFRLGSDPAPAARGFRKSPACTQDFSAGVVPGYGSSALLPVADKPCAYTDDFAETALIAPERSDFV